MAQTKEKKTEKEPKTEPITETSVSPAAETESENTAPEIVMTQDDLEARIKEDAAEVPVVNKKEKLPEFRTGDTIKIFYKIIEGDKTRIQPYEGIVIAIKGKEESKTFTVRRIGADGVGVERIIPLHSPNISKIEVKRRGKVRRAKLYYLRDKKGRAAVRVKEKIAKKTVKASA